MAVGLKPALRAQLTARWGCPFAFASPLRLGYAAIATCIFIGLRTQPSRRLEKPYAMGVVTSIRTAIDSNRDAGPVASMRQAFEAASRPEGTATAASKNMHQLWSASEQYGVQQALSMSLVGDKAKSASRSWRRCCP